MHPLLKRKLIRIFGEENPKTANEEQLTLLLQKIDAFLSDADRERALLERSLALSSKEMLDRLEALRQSEELFRSAFEYSGVGVVFVDPNARFMRVNPMFIEMVGYTQAELLEMSPLDITYPDDVDTTQKIWDRVGQGEDHFRIDKRFVHKDGGIVWTQVYFSVLRDSEKKPMYSIAQVIDVTSVIQSQKALEQERVKSLHSATLASLGEMAGGIAHEINNPLAIISGYSSQLLRWAESGKLDVEQLQKSATKINNTVDRISRIIRSLRHIARDGGGDPFTQTSIKQVVSEAFEFCHAKAKIRGLDVVIEQGEIDPALSVECRSVQIQQVLLNLINNAMDAVSNIPDAWVRVDTVDLGAEVQIRVTDSGKGIPPAIREKIMQPFFTTKEVGKGTGLGLSISDRIADTHHGSLWIDEECPNTRFVLQLPKLQPVTRG